MFYKTSAGAYCRSKRSARYLWIVLQRLYSWSHAVLLSRVMLRCHCARGRSQMYPFIRVR